MFCFFFNVFFYSSKYEFNRHTLYVFSPSKAMHINPPHCPSLPFLVFVANLSKMNSGAKSTF